MRDLEQAKAEVFRRSNARIKKRKAIGRSVIACCVPLVLCVGVFTAMALPSMMATKAMDSAESTAVNNMNGFAPDSAVSDRAELVPPEFTILYGSASNTKGSSTKNAAFLVRGEKYAISDEDAKVIRNILRSLNYNPYRMCRCLPQFQFECKSQGYGLHLSEGYARCEKGQAPLTPEQIQTIQDILNKYNLTIS